MKDTFDRAPEMAPPYTGICLTFDDWFVRGWLGARDLFRRYNARATFFIAKPHEMPKEAIRSLRILQDDGHEIGCHTLNHVRLPKFLQDHSEADYIEQEVLPALKILRAQGFEVTSFSYPYFKHRPRVTGMLLQHFRIVREGGPGFRPVHAIAPAAGNATVGTMGMLDRTGMNLPLSYYQERFDLLRLHGGYAAFTGHAIEPDTPKNKSMRCSLRDLEEIMEQAQNYGLAMQPLRQIGHRSWMYEEA